MNKKSIFTNFGFLSFVTLIAAVLAISIIVVEFTDDFIHVISMIILYTLFLCLIITVGVSFKTGKKEIVKAASASLFTIALVYHGIAFASMCGNYYYFTLKEVAPTVIGVGVVIIFILFIISYINHYRINATNDSNTKLVNINKVLLIFIGILSLAIACATAYQDYRIGRNYELYIILVYILHFFITLILASIESMIDMFRNARAEGKLNKVIAKTVGKKAIKANKSKKKK